MSLPQNIRIRGARTHNLKNIQIDIPRDTLTIITGLSGSGKSSLAFDTLYAEGQRRYVESLSSYARQFLSMMDKPEVDSIEGLSPAISIEQKATSHNPRSTVGTITEIYDYLRVLFARAGEARCPQHGHILRAKTISQMVDAVMQLPEGAKAMILAPVVRGRKGEYVQLMAQLQAQGYVRVRIDGEMYELEDAPALSLRKKHDIEVVVDRFIVRPDITTRLSESFENALRLADGMALVASMDESFSPQLYSARFACPDCGYILSELEPRLFSFNNPHGACTACDGLGVHMYIDPRLVVHDPKATLAAGAIRGWDKNHVYYYRLLESVVRHYGHTMDEPFDTLPEVLQQALLFGSGNDTIALHFEGMHAESYVKQQVFEGIVPVMQRRYRTSESEAVREELAKYLASKVCETCHGARLCEAARHVYIAEKTIGDVVHWSIQEALTFFENLHLEGVRGEIVSKLNQELTARFRFLVQVGLEYLTLARSAETLSGGEAQRIRLASQIGSGLMGVMYILDEPSIGLHSRDNARLVKTLLQLRDQGNTVIVVEHDEEAIRAADFIVDIGPGAGIHGGEIVASGTLADILAHADSLTGQYLSGATRIEVPQKRTPVDPQKMICLREVHCNNLHGVTIDIPIGLMTCITGVSGSGKSSLINDTLYPIAANQLNRAGLLQMGTLAALEGLEHCDKVIAIDQSPIGRTPRSNPATYTGLFTPIRELFAQTSEARARGYLPGRFSFNVRGGRCEACQGDGLVQVSMHFLPDMYVPCDECHGKRYNRETLEITYKGKNIHEVLEMTVEEAVVFFAAIPFIHKKCQTLIEVGLSYIHLGQSAVTLSGGEAQRIKLARELSKRSTGKTLYILDEPTTGLHFHDVKQLLAILMRLKEQGNTVIVIEHNLEVIKVADWLIDLGPEGGDKGGQLVAVGTPETVAACPHSYTGRFLAPYLQT